MAVIDRDDHDDMCHCSYQGRPWRPRAKEFLGVGHKDNLTFPEGKLRLPKNHCSYIIHGELLWPVADRILRIQAERSLLRACWKSGLPSAETQVNGAGELEIPERETTLLLS